MPAMYVQFNLKTEGIVFNDRVRDLGENNCKHLLSWIISSFARVSILSVVCFYSLVELQKITYALLGHFGGIKSWRRKAGKRGARVGKVWREGKRERQREGGRG